MSTRSPDRAGTPWLTAEEERAWRAYRRMVTAVQVRTAQDLAEHGLSEPDYEVLSTLSEQPGDASPLHRQAAKMGWSRSRLSRHATRMEARGLLRREPDPEDGRAVRVALTEHGRTLVDGFYAETCRRVELLPASLPPAQRDMMALLLSRVVTDNEVPVVFLDADEAPRAARH